MEIERGLNMNNVRIITLLVLLIGLFAGTNSFAHDKTYDNQPSMHKEHGFQHGHWKKKKNKWRKHQAQHRRHHNHHYYERREHHHHGSLEIILSTAGYGNYLSAFGLHIPIHTH